LSELGMLSVSIGTESEVTIFAPVSTPRVLDEPVLIAALTLRLTVTYDSHGVVNFFFVWIRAVIVAVLSDHNTLAVMVHAV